MSILVQKCGILPTIQDLGRTGFRRFGINPTGAMDFSAVRLVNILLGNDENEAVLEMHFPAPELLFEQPAVFAVGGAVFGAKLDNEAIENWRPYFAEKSQKLSFAGKTSGNRVYLSISGGFKIEKWLGSASTNLTAKIGGFAGRSLRAGDRIEFNKKPETENENIHNQAAKSVYNLKFPYQISRDLIPRYSSFPTVRIIAGAEFESLTALSEQNLLKQTFKIRSDSDRMGFRLAGEPLFLLDDKEIVSSAVDFGTIQLLPDNQMIVLMADSQTSGGYPRIAHVASVDLSVLAQLGANDKLGFEIISLPEAENLTLRNRFELNYLKLGVARKLQEFL